MTTIQQLQEIIDTTRSLSQNNKYDVTITTKIDSINRTIIEYSDTFEVK